jgi:hypothetical protein
MLRGHPAHCLECLENPLHALGQKSFACQPAQCAAVAEIVEAELHQKRVALCGREEYAAVFVGRQRIDIMLAPPRPFAPKRAHIS